MNFDEPKMLNPLDVNAFAPEKPGVYALLSNKNRPGTEPNQPVYIDATGNLRDKLLWHITAGDTSFATRFAFEECENPAARLDELENEGGELGELVYACREAKVEMHPR